MKFYTRDLYASIQTTSRIRGWLAHRRWTRADRAYSQHLGALRPTLAPSVRDFSDLSLHDGEVTSANFVDTTLVLELEGHGYWGPSGADLQEAMRAANALLREPGTVGVALPRRKPTSLTVTFVGVSLVEGLEQLVGNCWLYDEFHAAPDGAFDYQALLDRSEFRVIARDVTVSPLKPVEAIS